jgi:hypothetical protein
MMRAGVKHKATLLLAKCILTVNDSDKIDIIYFSAINNHFFKILLTYDNTALTEMDVKNFVDAVWDMIYVM